MSERITLVYILAASHSGSTLTAMLLGAHNDICTAGELKATSLGEPDKYRCSCKELIGQCHFWTGVSKEMKKSGFDYQITDSNTDIRSYSSAYTRKLLRPLCRGWLLEFVRDTFLWFSPVWRKAIKTIQDRNLALIKSIASVSNSNIIVDSSKIGLRLKYLLRQKDVDIKVLRVVRDGRAVALTYIDPEQFADATNPTLRGGGSGASREAEKLTIAAAANEWKRSNEESENLIDRLKPNQCYQISYEELCANTSLTMGKVFNYLGVTRDGWNPDFKDIEHHVIGNGMRLDDRNEVVLDERWREVLTEVELSIFEEVAGNMNKKLGYD